LPLIFSAFTTPANTLVIADTAAPPMSLPVAPIIVPKDPDMPLIDGSGAYLFSPFQAPGSTATFQTIIPIPAGLLPIFTVGLPITAFFTHAADETSSTTVSLQALNILGAIVLDVVLFTDGNGGTKQNATVGSGDTVVLAELVFASLQITVTTTVTAPAVAPYPFGLDGDYLGHLRVHATAVI
jgi:hypothetical protein